MTKTLARICALCASIDELSALADNGDILPEYQGREEVQKIVDILTRKLNKIPNWQAAYVAWVYSEKKYTSRKI